MRKKQSQESLSFYQSIVDIKNLAETGKSQISSMGSLKKMPFSFSDLHFIPAQVAKIPLNEEDKVKTEIVIGPTARQPLQLSSPILISALSYGAVSKNVKLVIARTAAKLKVGYNTGEGGALAEDLKNADKLIIQYSTGRFGITDGILKKGAAVEIRFGQGAYPGKGSFLPAEKMTPDIARIRGLKTGEAAYSPAHHPDIKSSNDLKKKVSWLRDITGGKPIGAKIGCGNIEEDVEILAEAGVDFIALDGFSGGTGATDLIVRENIGIPTMFALARARITLEKLGVRNKVSLIAGGGLRNSADLAKCLALGANAVYLGTAALIAINCEQYRICQTGLCPTGVTTHDPILTKQLKIDEGVRKLSNFLRISLEEIKKITRITGNDSIDQLNRSALIALNKDLARALGVKWLDGKNK